MLSWDWIAGFFQAEGCISHQCINWSQKYRSDLEVIRDFLVVNVPGLGVANISGPKHTITAKGLVTDAYVLQVCRGRHYILGKILPLLREHKRNIFSSDLLKSYPIQPITVEWITGFWEGDGYIRSSGNVIGFAQQYESVLKEIQQILGGKLTPHEQNYQLNISINKSNAYQIGNLLAKLQLPHRIAQVDKILI